MIRQNACLMNDVLGVKHLQSVLLQIAKRSVRQRTQRRWVARRRVLLLRVKVTVAQRHAGQATTACEA